jgi:hypothetical protein
VSDKRSSKSPMKRLRDVASNTAWFTAMKIPGREEQPDTGVIGERKHGPPDLANGCFGSLANLVSRGGKDDVGSSAPAQVTVRIWN